MPVALFVGQILQIQDQLSAQDGSGSGSGFVSGSGRQEPGYLAVAADEQLADFTLVGESSLVAADAEHALLLQDVLLPVQGHLTLQALKAL